MSCQAIWNRLKCNSSQPPSQTKTLFSHPYVLATTLTIHHVPLQLNRKVRIWTSIFFRPALLLPPRP